MMTRTDAEAVAKAIGVRAAAVQCYGGYYAVRITMPKCYVMLYGDEWTVHGLNHAVTARGRKGFSVLPDADGEWR